LLAPFAGLKIKVPALLIAGHRYLVLAFLGMDQVISNLAKNVQTAKDPHFAGWWPLDSARATAGGKPRDD
jgi:hypothetical protein